MPRLISTERGQGLNGRWLRLVGPSLPAITIEAADLPADVLALLDQYLDLCCTYGDPRCRRRSSSTTKLRIEDDEGNVEIVV